MSVVRSNFCHMLITRFTEVHFVQHYFLAKVEPGNWKRVLYQCNTLGVFPPREHEGYGGSGTLRQGAMQW